MRQRCCNPRNRSFKHYGGRGITVCARWKKYRLFLEDMGEKPAGLSIDRIDNDQGYCKENCRWTTRKVQMNNTRHNRILTFKGRSMNVTQWAAELGLNFDAIWGRLERGWTTEKALAVPIKYKLPKWKVYWDGEIISLVEFAKRVGVFPGNISTMLTRSGCSRNQVITLKQVQHGSRKRFLPEGVAMLNKEIIPKSTVEAIRKSNLTYAELIGKFGFSDATIWRIKTGQRRADF